MTEQESHNFIINVFQGQWPKWEFTEAQTEGWVKRLRRFDYHWAKQCVEEYAFRRTRQGLPPTGQIFASLKKAAIPRDKDAGDPVQLYNIIRPDGRRAGFPVSSAKGVPRDIEGVRREAEELLERVARGREGYYIQWIEPSIAPQVPF